MKKENIHKNQIFVFKILKPLDTYEMLTLQDFTQQGYQTNILSLDWYYNADGILTI